MVCKLRELAKKITASLMGSRSLKELVDLETFVKKREKQIEVDLPELHTALLTRIKEIREWEKMVLNLFRVKPTIKDALVKARHFFRVFQKLFIKENIWARRLKNLIEKGFWSPEEGEKQASKRTTNVQNVKRSRDGAKDDSEYDLDSRSYSPAKRQKCLSQRVYRRAVKDTDIEKSLPLRAKVTDLKRKQNFPPSKGRSSSRSNLNKERMPCKPCPSLRKESSTLPVQRTEDKLLRSPPAKTKSRPHEELKKSPSLPRNLQSLQDLREKVKHKIRVIEEVNYALEIFLGAREPSLSILQWFTRSKDMLTAVMKNLNTPFKEIFQKPRARFKLDSLDQLIRRLEQNKVRIECFDTMCELSLAFKKWKERALRALEDTSAIAPTVLINLGLGALYSGLESKETNKVLELVRDLECKGVTLPKCLIEKNQVSKKQKIVLLDRSSRACKKRKSLERPQPVLKKRLVLNKSPPVPKKLELLKNIPRIPKKTKIVERSLSKEPRAKRSQKRTPSSSPLFSSANPKPKPEPLSSGGTPKISPDNNSSSPPQIKSPYNFIYCYHCSRVLKKRHLIRKISTFQHKCKEGRVITCILNRKRTTCQVTAQGHVCITRPSLAAIKDYQRTAGVKSG